LSAAENLLAGAGRIDVGGVEEVDAGFQRTLDEGPAVLFAEAPRMVAALGVAIAHSAKANARHFKAGAAEFDVIHGWLR
jgi:hypothetical protein